MLEELQDEELLKCYVAGDMSAFTTLYNRHKGGTFRYLRRQIHGSHLAEDLHQDVWSQVISHSANFQPTAKFTTWLYTIARNKVIDQIRHLHVQNNIIVHSDEAQHETDLQDSTEHHEVGIDSEIQLQLGRQQVALKGCLNTLPINLLDVFLLKQEACMTAQQIAEVIQVTHEATKSRLRNAYKQLAHCLKQKLDLDTEREL